MGVVRGVLVEEHELAAFDLLADSALLVAGQRGLAQTREHVAAPRHLLDVLVLGDDPIAAIVESAHADRLLVPPDGRGLAQLGQLLDRQPLGVQIGIGEVETGGQVGDGLGH